MESLKIFERKGLYIEVHEENFNVWLGKKFLGRISKEEMSEIIANFESKEQANGKR